jgi:hypothetical protein
VKADDAILRAVRRSGAVTFDDLVRSGIKPTAVNRWLAEARAAGIVVDAGRRHADGPRGVRQFRLR